MATAQDGDAAARELPIRSNPDAEAFDIVATYHRLLAEDPDLTMPMAAIEALIEFLGHTPVKTVYETIDLVKTQSARLEAAVPNPLALSHGTHLFSQYLMNSLKQPAATAGGGGGGGARTVENAHESFEVVRQHLLRNGRLFAQRAKMARERIAVNARRYLRDGQTVLTMGGSRVVGTLLARAAEKHECGDYVDQPRNFKVIYAIDPALETESNKVVATLREKGLRVATVPFTSIAYVMAKVDKVIVGAEAVTANGGIISSLGTFQAAIVAKQWKKNFYVVAEQHKFGRTLPADQFDFTFDQAVIGFRSSSTAPDRMPKEPMQNPIDYTPPQYIDQFFADHRVMTPYEVASEVIDTLM